jgi:hypothetical protein
MENIELKPGEEKNWQMIENYYKAWKIKDFTSVKFAAVFEYNGPGGQKFNNSKDFLASASFLIKYVNIEMNVKMRFVNGDSIAVFYDFATDIPTIGTIPTAGLYTLKNGEIESITNYFDPRGLHAFREQMSKTTSI